MKLHGIKLTDAEWESLRQRFPVTGAPARCDTQCGRKAAPWPWLVTNKPPGVEPTSYTLRLCLRCADDVLWTLDPLAVVVCERIHGAIAEQLEAEASERRVREEDEALELLKSVPKNWRELQELEDNGGAVA